MGIQAPAGTAPSPAPSSRLRDLREDAADWCRGRSPWWRLPILLWLAWSAWRILRDPEAPSILGGITFGIHELGHLVTMGLGTFVSVACGSLFQVLAPLLVGALLARQRDYFGVCFAAGWLGYSLTSLSVYVGDARARQLPLLGFTDDPIHDWNYLLGKLGLLSADKALAGALRVGAAAVWLSGIACGAWLLWRMATSERRTPS
ncbi:MAG TPA: hypothetical protein VIE39_07725 [Thermoanaerobaculia bacterium]|jgi:hypothetical protein